MHSEITLDNISKIGPQAINPKMLICSICYSIQSTLKQCKNQKCLKLFCDTCYLKSKNNDNLCPYCRMTIDYRKLGDNITSIISKLLFYCNQSICCTAHYTLNDYTKFHMNHIERNSLLQCTVCNFDLSNTLNTALCIICNRKGCSKQLDSASIAFGPSNPSIDNCLRKCFICKESLCIKCIKTSNKNFICPYCPSNCFFCYDNTDAKYICDFCQKILCSKCKANCETCDFTFCKDRKCYKDKAEKCTQCSIIKTNYYTCLHTNLLQCNQCYSMCTKCNKRKGITECNSCSTLLCAINCGVKCKECKSINCASCMRLCSICKKVLCSSCSKECFNCSKNSMVTCKDCNSDTIRQCQYPHCSNFLCINCWNVCNYCDTISCSNHSITCLKCDDSMCCTHYHKCSLCCPKKEDDYKKLCLQRCTLQCSFCPNVTNVFCNPLNHKTTMVNTYNCEHDVCLSCVKKCRKCEKIVIQCLKCIVNYYFIHCKYCNEYLCTTCAQNCNICEDDYCNLKHVCYCCGKEDNSAPCLKCIYAKRIKCRQCSKALPQCDKCKNKYICSPECFASYNKRLNKNYHLCESFECSVHAIDPRNSFCLFGNDDNNNNIETVRIHKLKLNFKPKN